MKKTIASALCILAFLFGWLGNPAQSQDSAAKPPTALELEIGRTIVEIDQRISVLEGKQIELKAAHLKLKGLLAAYYRENRSTPVPAVDPDPVDDDDQVPVDTGRFEAPALAPVGSPTIVAIPGNVRYVDVLRGPPRAASGYELAEAIRMARPGDVIGMDGDFSNQRPISIGGGIEGSKPGRAEWKTEAIRDLAVIGVNPSRADSIGSLELWERYNGGGYSGGIESIRFENLTIRASKYARQPVFVPKSHTVGKISIIDCTIAGNVDGRYAGFGQKWGIRSAGRGTWDIRDTHCNGAQEHFAYLDSPQGDNFFIGLTMDASWRTMIQIVNRPIDNPGPPSAGRILIERCKASGIRGEGGSAFTVAGHHGEYYLRNCSVKDSDHGAFVAYSDVIPEHGVALYAGEDGKPYSTRYVEIDGFDVDLPNADRSHLQVAGVEHFVLRNFTIRGNQTALDLDSRFGAAPIQGTAVLDGNPIDLTGAKILNGRVEIDVPGEIDSYAGWQSARKVVQAGVATLPSSLE